MNKDDLKRSFLTAMMGFHYREYLRYCRLLRGPDKPLTQEETHRIASSIGKNVSHRAWQQQDD